MSLIFGIIGCVASAAGAVLLFLVPNGATYGWVSFIGAAFGLLGLIFPGSLIKKIISLVALLAGLTFGGFWLVMIVFVHAITDGIQSATSSSSNTMI